MAAIGSATNAVSFPPPVTTPQISVGRDADGDNDGTTASAAKPAAPVQQLATSGSVGTMINTTA